MRKLIKKIAEFAGVGLMSSESLKQLRSMESNMKSIMESNKDELFDLVLSAIPLEGHSNAMYLKGHSKAQLKQDIFVLLATNFKKNGFFVEFGATNGVELSNTYLLEKSFNWKGILAEPATIWHESLSQNRNAKIDHSCVWSKSDKTLKFNMVDEAALSTIIEFNDMDMHSRARKQGSIYDVTTISLNDLLEKHEAPQKIDYLSIDTEGSEFEILSNFDFSKYDISIITCEHNYTSNREKIYSLLIKNGYTRKFEGFSKWDDWYYKYQ